VAAFISLLADENKRDLVEFVARRRQLRRQLLEMKLSERKRPRLTVPKFALAPRPSRPGSTKSRVIRAAASRNTSASAIRCFNGRGTVMSAALIAELPELGKLWLSKMVDRAS